MTPDEVVASWPELTPAQVADLAAVVQEVKR